MFNNCSSNATPQKHNWPEGMDGAPVYGLEWWSKFIDDLNAATPFETPSTSETETNQDQDSSRVNDDHSLLDAATEGSRRTLPSPEKKKYDAPDSARTPLTGAAHDVSGPSPHPNISYQYQPKPSAAASTQPPAPSNTGASPFRFGQDLEIQSVAAAFSPEAIKRAQEHVHATLARPCYNPAQVYDHRNQPTFTFVAPAQPHASYHDARPSARSSSITSSTSSGSSSTQNTNSFSTSSVRGRGIKRKDCPKIRDASGPVRCLWDGGCGLDISATDVWDHVRECHGVDTKDGQRVPITAYVWCLWDACDKSLQIRSVQKHLNAHSVSTDHPTSYVTTYGHPSKRPRISSL
ncbi:hypothetical protein PLICRDRAFT_218321 [Plicaturopsis crispa FD-325 SS-3]|nr:hypothetical protein PLICRDRAFT_218321 [Plicaturopsis crispa FD-325 SS-3]